MNNFKITTKIISKEEILNSYSEMDVFYKNIIESLYTGKINNKLTIKQISVKDYQKSKSSLSSWDSNAGIYIFMENRFPVYIGKAGTGASEKHTYLKRINQEINHKNQTLPKKVMKVDNLLENNNISINDAIVKIKQFNLIFIKTGNKGDLLKAAALEAVLIALFHPKYNG